MKKIIKIVFSLLVSAGLYSCVSLNDIIPNEKIDIPFEGPMDSRLGYETIAWGTSYKKIKEEGVYPLVAHPDKSLQFNLGYTKKYSDGSEGYRQYYAHGNVEETAFFFAPDTKLLYKVEDTLSVNNPSFEYLHSRYGDFNEENVAYDKLKANGGMMYTNKGCIEGSPWSSLIIVIKASGKTTVTLFDPFAYVTVTKSPAWDSKYTNIVNDKWYCWASIDGNKKAVDYTFLQKNADGRKLIFGYHKSLESPVRSYLRCGLGWGTYTSGSYEIKTGTDIVSYKFGSGTWKCKIIDESFNYTEGEFRKTLSTFLSGEKFTVRHLDKVTEFNPAGFSEILKKWNISSEELDYAIANEEF